jgi:hypothetical protein
MAKALVNGLDVEGVEQMWSKLNRNNIIVPKEETVEDKLFYINPSYILRKKTARKKSYNMNQLLLPGF